MSTHTDTKTWFSKEDVEHHNKVIGTTGGNVDTSPVGCVKRGFFPVEYLDRFNEDSTFWNDIEQYKASLKTC